MLRKKLTVFPLFITFAVILPFLACSIDGDIDSIRAEVIERNKLTVTFVHNGGTPEPESQRVSKGKTVTMPDAMSKSGYIFDGWYTEAGFINEWDFDNDTVSSAMSLYARWDEAAPDTFTVVFSAGGGTPVPNPQSVDPGGVVVRPEDPSKDSHIFAGWFTELKFDNRWDFATDTVTEDIVLYARWIAGGMACRIVYNVYGGNPEPEPIYEEYGTKLKEPATMTKTGFTFDGWYKEPALTARWDFSNDTIIGNTTLYAKWSCAVIFSANGGTPPPDTRIVTPNSTIASPGAMTNGGYTFDAWYKEADFINEWNFTTDIITVNTALYARWCSAVTFDANDATDGMAPAPVENITAGSSVALPDQGTLDRIGYTFGGWNTDAPGMGTNYNANDPFTPEGNTTLYARWYSTVTFSANNATGGTVPAPVDVNAGSGTTIPGAGTLARTGHAFGGWNTQADGAGDHYAPSVSFIPEGDILLYAKWTINTYTVTVNPAGGSWDGDTSNKSVQADWNTIIDVIVDPARERADFAGWYTQQAGGTLFTFTTPVTANITLYARWDFTLPLTDVDDIATYLAQSSAGNTANNPAILPMQIDLGTMTQTDSGWWRLLTAIANAGKYVSLDLSACDMDGTEFNPDCNMATGKNRIVEIALPVTAESIAEGSWGYSTFKNFDNLKSFTGAGLTSIGSGAFDSCTGLMQITLPAGLTYIGAQAFYNCMNLALVTCLTEDPPELGADVFYNTHSSLLIKVSPGTVAAYKAAPGWSEYMERISGTISSLSNVISYLTAQAGGMSADDPVYLPMQIDLGTMTQADSGWRRLLDAIANAGKYVSLDLSPCTMNGTSFNPDYNIATGKSRIVDIILPDTANSIAEAPWETPTFIYFSNLKSFNGAGLTAIGSSAFLGCRSLAQTSLPSGLTSIGDLTFQDCTSLALTSLPAGLTFIGDWAFQRCSVLALTSLPEGLTSIGICVFQDCFKLALTSLPAGLTSIGLCAFQNCWELALTAVPPRLTTIGDWAFSECTSLTRITFPEGLTSIGGYTFHYCCDLTEITLPSTLTFIGDHAFQNCNNLALITCLATTPPEMGNYAFSNTHSNLHIKVPADSVGLYKVAPVWSTYAGRISGIEESGESGTGPQGQQIWRTNIGSGFGTATVNGTELTITGYGSQNNSNSDYNFIYFPIPDSDFAVMVKVKGGSVSFPLGAASGSRINLLAFNSTGITQNPISGTLTGTVHGVMMGAMGIRKEIADTTNLSWCNSRTDTIANTGWNATNLGTPAQVAAGISGDFWLRIRRIGATWYAEVTTTANPTSNQTVNTSNNPPNTTDWISRAQSDSINYSGAVWAGLAVGCSTGSYSSTTIKEMYWGSGAGMGDVTRVTDDYQRIDFSWLE